MFQGFYSSQPASEFAVRMTSASWFRRGCAIAAMALTAVVLIAPSCQAFAQEPVSRTDEKATVADGKKSESDKDIVAIDASSEDVTDLLTEDLTKHWQVFSSSPAMPDAPVWKVIREGSGDEQELVLVCSGEPKGFLYTTESCSEFELTLEWKYPKDADGNSGVLVYTQDEPRIWPTSMQVQLHQPKAGSVFPSGDAMSDQTSEAEPNLARPVNVWNEGKIVSRGGRLSVEVNSKKAGEVSGAKPSSGSIALQSEGSVVHFRRIRLRRLPPAEPVPPTEPVEKANSDVSATSSLDGSRTMIFHAPQLTRRHQDRHRIAVMDGCDHSLRSGPTTLRQRRHQVQ